MAAQGVGRRRPRAWNSLLAVGLVTMAIAGACTPDTAAPAPAAGFSVRLLHSAPLPSGVQVSADGRHLVYLAPSSSFPTVNDIRRLDLATDTDTVIYSGVVLSNGATAASYSLQPCLKAPGNDNQCYGQTSVSADGSLIARMSYGQHGSVTCSSVGSSYTGVGTCWGAAISEDGTVGTLFDALHQTVCVKADGNPVSTPVVGAIEAPLNNGWCLEATSTATTPATYEPAGHFLRGAGAPSTIRLDSAPNGDFAPAASWAISGDNTAFAFAPFTTWLDQNAVAQTLNLGTIGGCVNGGILLHNLATNTTVPVGYLPNGACVDPANSPIVKWVSGNHHLVVFTYDSGSVNRAYLPRHRQQHDDPTPRHRHQRLLQHHPRRRALHRQRQPLRDGFHRLTLGRSIELIGAPDRGPRSVEWPTDPSLRLGRVPCPQTPTTTGRRAA